MLDIATAPEVCLYLGGAPPFALFRAPIDQQELGELSHSDAPRQAANECPSGPLYLFTLLAPCIIKQDFEIAAIFFFFFFW